jgi:hypothetical protein
MGGGAQRPILCVNELKKDGCAQRTGAHARPKSTSLSYIYLGYFVCLCVIVCVCVTIAECSAILLVLAIKLTKVTRRRAWRGRDRDGEIGKGQIGEGRCE